ncbi:MAG: TldD/PmbA family protein [Myxococcales bacterium]|nr:TldD/PmbA family protein [Myxococcales bacterium]
MSDSELLKAASAAVEIATKAGANDAWASVSRDRSVSHGFRDGKLEKVSESTSRGLGISIYVDGRYSSHSTTDLRADRLRSFIEEAVALTKALQPDPFRKIPEPELFEGRPTLDLQRLDPALAGVTAEKRLEWCGELDEHAHGDERVISAESGVFSGESAGASVSSNGFSGEWEGGYIGMSASATVREDADKRPEGSYFVYDRFVDGLPKAGAVADEALARALARLGSTKGPTGKATMVVDAQAAVSLLARLMGPASAASIQQGRSFWAGKLGERLFGEKLTITDDPLIPRGLASRHFDGEGISAKAMPLIDRGVIRNYYVDTYYGRKLGMAPTSGSPSNRVVSLGKRSLAELLKAAGKGIYVTSWLGGNADPTTGDFSLGLRGHLIEKGKIGAPVGEMNVTGNLAELFGHLTMLGNDPYPYSSIRAPSLVFEGVNFSGA